jgi:hypothetical protein
MAANPAQPQFSLSRPKPRPISLPATTGPLFIVPIWMFREEFGNYQGPVMGALWSYRRTQGRLYPRGAG